MGLFRGKASRKVALYLFLRRDEETLKSIIGATGTPERTVLWALGRLVEDHLVTRSEQKGGWPIYEANRGHPLARDLFDLAIRSLGDHSAEVRAAVACPGITRLAIFGSYAKGTFQSHSDIDLLVVTRSKDEPSATDVINDIAGVVLNMGIEMSPRIVTEDDLVSGSKFLDSVRSENLIVLKGAF